VFRFVVLGLGVGGGVVGFSRFVRCEGGVDLWWGVFGRWVFKR